MPSRDEDMQKRRQRREAMRKKQEAQARQLRRRLLLAAVALVLCGLGIAALIPDSDPNEAGQLQSDTAATQTPRQETRATSPAQKDPITTIHIRAAGDLNVTDTVISSGLTAAGYEYSAAFKDVAAVLSEADLTVMNFEGNVCGEPYGTETTSAPIELIQGLRNAGVDLLQMANSCSVNNGINGLTATLRAIRSAGIEPIGAFSSSSEFQSSKGYTIVEVQNIKLAFVAFTKGLGGRGMPAGNEDLVNLLYTDYATEYQEIDRERAALVSERNGLVRILRGADDDDADGNPQSEEIASGSMEVRA